MSRGEDPRWDRDGLTDWDFDELPAEIELPRGRLAVKAYPALLDRGSSVSLRLVDSPRRAEDETHFGLRRLCFLATQRELKPRSIGCRTSIRWSVARRRLRVSTCAGGLPSCWPTAPWWPISRCRASKDEFERLLAAGRERIGWAVQELTALAGPIFEGYHQTCLAVEEFCARGRQSGRCRRCSWASVQTGARARQQARRARAVPRWQYAIDDIRQQIARLMEPQSFSKTPWDWLRQYPRYFPPSAAAWRTCRAACRATGKNSRSFSRAGSFTWSMREISRRWASLTRS